MSVLFQISLGSGVLVFCILTHMATVIWVVRRLREARLKVQTTTVRRTFIVSSLVLLAMLLSHTFHVYVWALSLWLLGALIFLLFSDALFAQMDIEKPRDLLDL